uniref:MARVEL domain containing 2b n=1 Tax=Cynoglossus semilaevis TaxID=244447 RepID=A0A3P8VWQ1_CYNSE
LFVLVEAHLAWIVTVILVVLGMSMYYRAILLDSSWWPLTECSINLVLAVLFIAAGVVYVRDTTTGGLCNIPVFNNGMNGAFCRTEAGQTAAIVFIFLNMTLYFVSTPACLKLWRHEAARMRREALASEVRQTNRHLHKRLIFYCESSLQNLRSSSVKMLHPEILQGHIPAGHIPKPVVIVDYVAKYPSIHCDEERDHYKAVFNDQYAEYKEVHTEVQAMATKFEEMDKMMTYLSARPSSQMVKKNQIKLHADSKIQKQDPTYLEKRERCEYLKKKTVSY